MLVQLEIFIGRKVKYGFFVINMEYGRNFFGFDKDVFFDDWFVGYIEDVWQFNFFYFVIYYYRYFFIEQEVRFCFVYWFLFWFMVIYYIVEDFLIDWIVLIGYILFLRCFLENCLDIDL